MTLWCDLDAEYLERTKNRLEAQRSGFKSEKEEGANIVQFSPQGGKGTVFAPSDGADCDSLRSRA